MENLFIMTNAAAPTTGLPAGVTTGTAANCLLQLATPSTKQITLVEYGFSCTGTPSGLLLNLRNTSSAATMGTAGVIQTFSNPGGPATVLTSSTTTCGFNSGSTVTPTGTTANMYDMQTLSSNTYIKQWPLGREPTVPVSGFLQLVVDAAAAVTASCYLIWRE